MEKYLHIVALDIPYPVAYGGVFDLFYKLKAFHEKGIRIFLHCFADNARRPEPALDRYCERVFYYQRKKGVAGISLKYPYIVSSRKSRRLADQLAMDDHPVLLEGIHCTHLLRDKRFEHRRIVLRLHNIEYIYYRQLYQSARSLAKKIYYLAESILLKKYEADIAGRVSVIAAVTANDAAVYADEFLVKNIAVVPVFAGFEKVNALQGTGSYCLYHGNLSVAENEAAAVWLIRNVFSDLPLPLIISGKAPSSGLVQLVKRYPSITIVADPSEEKMSGLVRDAQVHVLPSFSATGIKLKLLNALYNGRHCVANVAATEATGLASLCHTAVDATAFRQTVQQLCGVPFTQEDIDSRQRLLSGIFDTDKNISLFIQWLW